MLTRLAGRDGSVELSRAVDGEDAAAVTYRSRVFNVRAEDGCIIVETPRQAVQDRAFRVDDDLELTLIADHDRMVATCTLHEVVTHSVNDALKLTCYRLSPGRRPMRDQRRFFYRVNVAGMELNPIELSCELEDEDHFAFAARLVNISAGGLGISIRASRPILNQIKRTRSFESYIDLGDDQPIKAPVSVVHVSAMGEDGLCLGMRFDIEDETAAANHDRVMQKRCTEIQRMQLRRRRA